MQTTTNVDPWKAGYEAGRMGLAYTDNPYGEGFGGTAWAFGCSEGWKARQAEGLRRLLAEIAKG